ncbi:EFR3 [Sanghuangporus sanghuang]
MPFPLAPHHVQLIAACYPPSSALLTSGPEYKPNSQELSRLTYYASNRPGKIAKLGSELEKRALTDARKASSGNVRARASLLITLNIFKALTQECRRDLSLLATSLMSTLDSTLAVLSNDLEVAAKVASVFVWWSTYTNGQLLGIDQTLTRDYISTLHRFSSMCLSEAKDSEDRNRMRVIGLGALTGAVASEALYNSPSQIKAQASAIVPALLVNLLQVDTSVLDYESEYDRISPPLGTFLADFRSRPLLERRAASIHLRIDGDEGPTSGDVANAALKAFACLLSQSNGGQVSVVMQAALDSLGLHDGWKHINHCCWFTRKAIEWTQYQYRFAVPARLIDRLMEAQEDSRPSDLHKTLAAMIKAAFTAPVPLVNLSTSDVCSNLTALILRRIAINPNDDLLPDLVGCVGALGMHIYYADQIHDLACEIIGRITHVEGNGFGAGSQTSVRRGEGRVMALRSLIACVGLLIQSSTKPLHQHATSADGHGDEERCNLGATLARPENDEPEAASPRPSSDGVSLRASLPRRSRIPPDVWQETLSLLCDESFAVRSDYARILVLYLKSEIRPELRSHIFPDGTGQLRPTRTLEDGSHPIESTGLNDGPTSRFLNALQATVFMLATSSHLGLPPSSPPSPVHSLDDVREHELEQRHDSVNVNITPSTPLQEQSFAADQEQAGEPSIAGQSSRRKSLGLATQLLKLHRIRRLLDAALHQSPRSPQLDTGESSACLSDYAHILHILNAVHEQTPTRALLTGFPMLLALRSWCDSDLVPQHRRFAVRQVLVGQWQTLSRIWDIPQLVEVTKNTTSSASFPYPPPEISFPDSEEPLGLHFLSEVEGNDESNSWCGNEPVILSVSKNTNIQRATGFDEASLAKRLGIQWSPDNALRDSVESSLNGDSPRPEHGNPLLKISPALMHISNLSLQSLTRSNRGVGVNDLRDALEGRGAMSNIALSQGRAPSVASIGATHSGASGESATSPSIWSATRPRPRLLSGESRKDVKNVLDKLGIGSNKTTSPPRLSPSPNQSAAVRSLLIPPYKG